MKLTAILFLTGEHVKKYTTEEEYSTLIQIRNLVEHLLKNFDANTKSKVNKN